MNGGCFSFVLLPCKLAHQASHLSKNSFQSSTWRRGMEGLFGQGLKNDELACSHLWITSMFFKNLNDCWSCGGLRLMHSLQQNPSGNQRLSDNSFYLQWTNRWPLYSMVCLRPPCKTVVEIIYIKIDLTLFCKMVNVQDCLWQNRESNASFISKRFAYQ